MMQLVPLKRDEAKAWVEKHHRHNKPPLGDVFRVGLALDGQIVGVAIAGRPVARGLDDGRTLEVTRVCTVGLKNACTMLYGACRRAAAALGYQRLVTYTLASEPGTSPSAAGFVRVREVKGRQWSCPSRPRELFDTTPDKIAWEMKL